jgi:hypothetical protein
MKTFLLRIFLPCLLFMTHQIEANHIKDFLKTRFLIGSLIGGYTGAIVAGISVMATAAAKQNLLPNVKVDAKRIESRKRCLNMSMATGGVLGSYFGQKFLNVPQRLRIATTLGGVILLGAAELNNSEKQ